MQALPQFASVNEIERHHIETFLYREAALLDRWALNEWLTLFDEAAEYLIPPLDARDAPPEQALYLVADNYARLRSRVNQLKKGNAHAESPPSRTRRAITNVLVEARPDDTVHVDANFVIHRIRRELMDTYVGRYEHVLKLANGQLRFLQRKAILDLDALRPQGKVSIIV